MRGESHPVPAPRREPEPDETESEAAESETADLYLTRPPFWAETQDLQSQETVSKKDGAETVETEWARWEQIEKQHLDFFDELHAQHPKLLDQFIQTWFRLTEARRLMVPTEVTRLDQELQNLIQQEIAPRVNPVPSDLYLFIVKWVNQQPDVDRYRTMWEAAEEDIKTLQRGFRSGNKETPSGGR